MAPYLPPYRRACRLDRSARTMPVTKLDIELQRVVAAWLERSGMSAGKLGELALEDAGFVAELNRGRSPRLDAVDRLLGFMGIAPIGPRFRQEIEAFLIVTRTRPTLLGTRAVGKSSFVRDLRSGTLPTLASTYRVRTWMHGFANELDRTAIAWVLANDAPAPPYGLCAVFAPWTDDDRGVGMLDETTFLTVRETATLLGLSPRTLDGYRVTGDGPAFHRFGSRVLYARFDVEAWVKAKRPRKLASVA